MVDILTDYQIVNSNIHLLFRAMHILNLVSLIILFMIIEIFSGVYAVYVGQYENQSTKSISSLVDGSKSSSKRKVLTQFNFACTNGFDPTDFHESGYPYKQDQLNDIIGELQKLSKILDGDVREVLE